jgi:hypothetical protein
LIFEGPSFPLGPGTSVAPSSPIGIFVAGIFLAELFCLVMSTSLCFLAKALYNSALFLKVDHFGSPAARANTTNSSFFQASFLLVLLLEQVCHQNVCQLASEPLLLKDGIVQYLILQLSHKNRNQFHMWPNQLEVR